MKIFPCERTVFKSKLSEKEVKRRIVQTINSKNLNWGKSFDGSISNNEFRIHRLIWYRNSFLPELNGRIISDPDGTLIEVETKMFAAVRIFMIIFCAVAFFIFMAGIWACFVNRKLILFVFAIPLIMLAIFFISKISFKWEGNKAKRLFAELIDA